MIAKFQKLCECLFIRGNMERIARAVRVTNPKPMQQRKPKLGGDAGAFALRFPGQLFGVDLVRLPASQKVVIFLIKALHIGFAPASWKLLQILRC